MAAYIIVYREGPVRDEAAMAEYQRLNRASPPGKFDLKPLVIYGAIEGLEGQAPDGVILLQFPTVEEARAWYDSPEYQAALPYRQKAADHRAIIVEGF